MNTDQVLAEIREVNLSYLMLAQSLIRADREQALFRLGIPETTADIIATLTPSQVMKIASSSTLLCRLRAEDDLVWTLLASSRDGARAPAGGEAMARLHAGILMAGRHQEAA